MPRNNPLRTKDSDTLAMEWVVRMEAMADPNPSPKSYMYSLLEIADELQRRHGVKEANVYFDRAKESYKLLG